MVNLKSFICKDFLRKKYELTVYFKCEMIGKHFTETLNKVELRINHARPVYELFFLVGHPFFMVKDKHQWSSLSKLNF